MSEKIPNHSPKEGGDIINRREFLRKSVKALGGLTLASQFSEKVFGESKGSESLFNLTRKFSVLGS